MFRQDWKNGLYKMLLVAIAAFVITGFTLVNAGNQITVAAADLASCEAAVWITDDSHIPLDVVDRLCFLGESGGATTAGNGANRSFSRAVDSGEFFEAYLEAMELTERESKRTFAASLSGFENSGIYWGAYLESLAQSERDLGVTLAAPSAGFDRMSGVYALEMEKHAMTEGQ